jgi:hypothetical protein
MKDYLYVGEKNKSDKNLRDWIKLSMEFVSTLPRKK